MAKKGGQQNSLGPERDDMVHTMKVAKKAVFFKFDFSLFSGGMAAITVEQVSPT